MTEEVQMHRVAAAAAGSATAPGLPSASVAASVAQDQQNTWKALMDMQQQMISFQTGLMRVLENATIAAVATRGAADAAHGSGRPSGSLEPRNGAKRQIWAVHNEDPSNQGAARRSRSSTSKSKSLLHERNVQKLVLTQREIDRRTSVVSAMEQSKLR